MILKVIKGSLVDLAKKGEFDVIIHGTNCFHWMGFGVSRRIKESYPSAYDEDLKTPKGDKTKLGTYSNSLVGNTTIVNAYIQYNYGLAGGSTVDLDAIRKVFRKIALKFSGKKIGYEKLGILIANEGQWNKCYEIIKEELKGCDHTLVEY